MYLLNKVKHHSRSLKKTIKNFEFNKKVKAYNKTIAVRNSDRGVIKTPIKFSIVSAVYGVEKYLDKFIASVVDQTVPFEENLELILVDDGSTDSSAEVCKKWQRQYPDNIKYIFKENGGQASARNIGLEYASHDWLTFIDPDDFIKEDYFEVISHHLEEDKSLGMVMCNLVFFNENTYANSNRHPLRFHFEKGARKIIFDNNCLDFQLSASSAIFRMDIIRRHNLAFRTIRPNFEDAFFVAQYILTSKNHMQALVLPNAFYYYRKRSDLSSSIDSSWQKQEKYKDLLKNGYLALFKYTESQIGYVPKWVQNIVFYDTSWYFNYLVDNHAGSSFLTVHNLQKEFIDILREIYSYIDINNIDKQVLNKLNHNYLLGICKQMYDRDGCNDFIEASGYVSQKKQACFVFCSTNIKAKISFRFNGVDINTEKLIHKSKRKSLLNSVFYYEHIFYVHWEHYEQLSIYNDGSPLEIKLGRNKNEQLSRFQIEKYFDTRKPRTRFLSGIDIYRRLSQLPYYKNKYHKAWLLLDRDIQADDNAEHMYQYLSDNNLPANIWFVLRRTSHDWERLQRKGFKLIEFSSVEHKLALINAEYVISSHADHYVMNLLNKKHYRDLIKFNFVFLQHGVIKDDLSEWLNRKDIKYFICSAKPEYDSIADDGTSYKFTKEQVVLTGLPRHDELFRKNNFSRESIVTGNKKKIIIMPTWRQGLVGKTLEYTNERLRNADFENSLYYNAWNNFLRSEKLRHLKEIHNLEVVFFPHLNVEQYFIDNKYESVTVLSSKSIESIQDLFVEGDLMITDYSSVAFESAYIETPIIYFQFDRDFMFNGGHLFKLGYFDYFRDGFGPVCEDEDSLLLEIEKLANNNFNSSEPYTSRMKDFFPYRDGKCCERVYQLLTTDSFPGKN